MTFLAGMSLALAAVGQSAAPRFIGDEINVIRWREDYSFLREREDLTLLERLKFVALNDAKTDYVTLGGEIRERVESYDHAFFGLPGGRSYTAFATRVLADADLHLGDRFRAFAELGSFYERGRKPVERPFDRGDLELQQGFVDFVAVRAADERLTFRAGRQEFPLGSGRLVAIRDSTNARLAFDAAKIEWIEGRSTVTAFAGRPVFSRRGVFESESSDRESFWALDWSGAGAAARQMNTELFYLGRHLRTAAFAEATAGETRHTLGGRIWARPAPWDYSLQASFQFGSLGNASIRAWGVASDMGYSIASYPAHPRLALRADIASGDGKTHDGVLGTFEAPYPALNYFTEAAIFAPGNGYDLHPYLQLQPAKTVTVEVGAAFLWRLRKSDAVYRAGGGVLVPPGISDARYVTGMFQIDATWKPIPFLSIQGAVVRAPAGRLVKDAGGKSTTFVLLSSDLKL
jgi:Alginate export